MRNGRRTIRASISRMSIQLTSDWWARLGHLCGRRARVRCWAGGGRLVWRRGQGPGRRSRSVSGRSPGASYPALRGAPLTQSGVCVSGGDPLAGLAVLGLPPAVLSGDRSFAGVLRLAGRSAHLAGELAGKSPVAFAGLGFHAWAEPELLGDALGAHRGLAVHPARPRRPHHRVRPWPSLMVVVLIVEDPTWQVTPRASWARPARR